MKALAFFAACSMAIPVPRRMPSPGVAPIGWYPQWVAPAVLCVESRLIYIGEWVCA